MKKLALLLLAAALLLTVSCGKRAEETDGKPVVVATLFPHYDFARNIAGDRMNVELLMSAGSDAHTFDPAVSDIVKMNSADIFIYTGNDMESWAHTFIDTISDSTLIVDLSNGVEYERSHEGEHSHADPHIWTSPKNAIQMVNGITDALCSFDPEGEQYYRENAAKYTAQLETLSEELLYLAGNAKGKTLFFGGKFSFHHLMEDYGFSYMTLYDGCSESAEPSAKRLSQLTRLMKEESAKVIFYPELTQGKSAHAIAEETGARALLLHSCHNLSNDDYKAGEDYISLMQKNLQNIREAIS